MFILAKIGAPDLNDTTCARDLFVPDSSNGPLARAGMPPAVRSEPGLCESLQALPWGEAEAPSIGPTKKEQVPWPAPFRKEAGY